MSIKRRITLAMAALVALAALSAGASQTMSAKAGTTADAALSAARQAAWASEMRAQVRGFVSEAVDVALALREGSSAELSAEYGDLRGADIAVRSMLTRGSAIVDEAELEQVAEGYETLRLDVTDWVNAESASARRPLLLLASDDKLIASAIGAGAVVPGAETVAAERIAMRAHAEALFDGELRLMVRGAEEEARAAQLAADAARGRAALSTTALMALNILGAAVVGIWLYRTIVTPLSAAQAVASRVAAGELDAEFPEPGEDEVGVLVATIEQMRDAVIGKVSAMREVAGAVLVTSESLHATVVEAAGFEPGDAGLADAFEELDASSRLLNQLATQMITD